MGIWLGRGVEYLMALICSPSGVTNAIRIYENHDGQYEDQFTLASGNRADSGSVQKLPVPIPAGLQSLLDAEGLVDSSFFHLSDEPHGEEIYNYRKARAILEGAIP